MTEGDADRVWERADAFRKVREAHQTEMAEDYVELIGDLIRQHGEARLTDIADNLGVTQATASKVVARLRRDGLVENRRYRSIFLSEAGKAMAAMSRARHQVVFEFLCALGVDEATAHADSEGMEHHVSEETLTRLEQLTTQLRRQ
jgi:DtxR family transcriptional regulator, manganese transport regulator